MPDLPRFHLAFPVRALEPIRRFYVDLLGCRVGRESDRWIDFDFFGHQITAHLAEPETNPPTNPVDGDEVPARHFGAILDWEDWQEMAGRLRQADVRFLIEPRIRFAGEPGEQATMFVLDPSDNALEFKAFREDAQVFSR